MCIFTRHADIHLSSLWKKKCDSFRGSCENYEYNRWYDVDFKIETAVGFWDVYFTITSENTLLEKVLGDIGKDTHLHLNIKSEKEVIVTKKEDSV